VSLSDASDDVDELEFRW